MCRGYQTLHLVRLSNLTTHGKMEGENCPRTYYLAQADLKLVAILLPPLPGAVTIGVSCAWLEYFSCSSALCRQEDLTLGGWIPDAQSDLSNCSLFSLPQKAAGRSSALGFLDSSSKNVSFLFIRNFPMGHCICFSRSPASQVKEGRLREAEGFVQVPGLVSGRSEACVSDFAMCP